MNKEIKMLKREQKKREIIKKTASFYQPNASLLSSFLELDPNKYIEKPKEDKSKIRIQKLMDKIGFES